MLCLLIDFQFRHKVTMHSGASFRYSGMLTEYRKNSVACCMARVKGRRQPRSSECPCPMRHGGSPIGHYNNNCRQLNLFLIYVVGGADAPWGVLGRRMSQSAAYQLR